MILCSLPQILDRGLIDEDGDILDLLARLDQVEVIDLDVAKALLVHVDVVFEYLVIPSC